MRRLSVFAVLALALFGGASAQVPKDNPLVGAARSIGARGLGAETLATKADWSFKPADGRIFVKGYVAGLTEDAAEQAALEQSIVAFIGRYEKAAATLKQPNDPATALAFSVAILTSAAKGTDLDDESFLALTLRFRAVLGPIAASDRQKQAFYEYALCASGSVVSLMAATTDEAARERLKALAGIQLLALVGAKPEAITLKGSSVAIKGAGSEAAPGGPAASSLRIAFPAGWRESGGWHVGQIRDGSNVHSALVRVVPAVPAKGSFSDALRAAWKRYMPEEMQGKAGGMVFRRYVGDGLVAQFVCGSGTEKGQKWDTLFTVYLIDCGATWQPLVVAQTWGDAASTNPIYSPWTISGSFRHSIPLVETFLKGLACPAAKGRPLVDRAPLAGTFYFGTSSGLQWTNVYTGASTMTTVSYGGTLSLLTNGGFTEDYSNASGVVGSLRFRGFKAKGTWAIQGDLLALNDTAYDQGDGVKRRPKRYRIAGLVVFPDGEKVVVLKDKVDEPVNPLTVSDQSEYYSTKKKG